MSEFTATELAADRLVKQIVKKYADVPEFSLVIQYKDAASYFDLVPRKYDGSMELVGFIQDPRYSQDPETKDVPFRRWFTLAVIKEKRIPTLF